MEDKEILEILAKEKRPYDFVANNYWRLSKEQLRDLYLEAIGNITNDAYHSIVDHLAEWLVEYRGWEE